MPRDAESERIIEGLPAEPGGELDRAGRPAICSAQFGDVLGDPNAGRGRYAAGIRTHTPDGEAAQVPYKIGSWFTYSDPFLRLYANPHLLRAVESVYGEEFVPFNESMVIKRGEVAPAISWHQVCPSPAARSFPALLNSYGGHVRPGPPVGQPEPAASQCWLAQCMSRGLRVALHVTRLSLHGLQDGGTHWDWERPEHGFNFMVNLADLEHHRSRDRGVVLTVASCVSGEPLGLRRGERVVGGRW